MGRRMPAECGHGVIVDGGDFCDSEECIYCNDSIKHDEDVSRTSFELWAQRPPREWGIFRIEDQYRYYYVKCAWEAWEASRIIK